jgi:hypothetical protein
MGCSQNGYSPPLSDKDKDANATTIKQNATQVEQDVEQPPRTHKDKQNQNRRQRKKKKKQEVATKEAEEAATKSSATTSVASVPTIPDIKQQEQDDPMMTALLGMGFMQDQIYAAAKACGGFHRATADDLVVWILSQGAEQDDIPTTEESNDPKPMAVDDDDAFVVNESTSAIKTKGMVVPEEQKDATLTEEEAKKQQEAEERLKAKREEKRRRNREWNNREQERQQAELQTKMAQALIVPHAMGDDFPTGVAPSDTHLLSPSYPSLETGLSSALPSGQPLGVAASAPVAPLKAPPIPTTATAATTTPPTILKPNRESQRHPSIANKADFPPMHQASNLPPMQQLSSLMYTNNNPSITPTYGFPSVIGDDDKTVSSLGSNPSRGQSVTSNNNVSSFASSNAAVLPPGFRPPTSSGPGLKQPPPIHPHAAFPLGPESFASDANSLGEIRATAKAFVPLNFTPAPAAARSSSIPLHGGQQASSLGRPYDDNAGALPTGFLMGPAGSSSLLLNARQQSYDRTLPTPLSEDDSPPVLITASSMTAVIPSLGESSSVPPLQHHGHHHGSSLLDSISNGNDDGGGIGGGGGAVPMGGSSSLWGGPSSFGGLPPFRFGDTDATTGNNDNVGTIMKESNITGLGWGGFSSHAGDARNNPPSGQGSIW